MRQINYALVPERLLDTPVYRKGWRSVKPRPRPYPKPASSVGAAAILAARRRSREDDRPMVPAPAFQDNYVGSHYAHVPERPLDTPVYRKSSRPVKPRPRPYPKPAASIGAAAIIAARRRSREDTRPLVPAPAIQNVDNYAGFPPIIAGYVPQYGDDMEIDAMGPFFTPVVPGTTNGNTNPLPYGVTAANVNGIPLNGAPGIQLIVGYLPELSENMEVDWEGSSIPSNPSYHPIFNVPPYGDPQAMADAPHLGIAGISHPIINGAHQVQVTLNTFPPNSGIVDPPYDPREPLFPTYPVQPPAPKTLNAPPVVIAEEHPGDRGELFNELFGDDDDDEEEEGDTAPELPWGGGGNLTGGLDGSEDEDEDENEVEIVI